MLFDSLREFQAFSVEIREMDMTGRTRYAENPNAVVNQLRYPFFWKAVRKLGHDYHIESLSVASFSYGCRQAAVLHGSEGRYS